MQFRVSTQADLSTCLQVVNSKGKNFFEDNLSFTLPLIAEYKEIDRLQYHLSVETDRHEYANLAYSFNNLDNELRELKSNEAFNGRSCVVRPHRPLPREPDTVCSSEQECNEEGAAICYSRFLGTEGCGLASREFNIPGLLSSPTCSAIAAELAGEKYGLPEAFIDLIHGLVDDYAEQNLRSDSLWHNLLGTIALGTNYAWKFNRTNQCVVDFTNQFYGVKMRWLQQIDQIKQQPYILKRACDQQLSEYISKKDKIEKRKERYEKLKAQLVDADTRFETIRNERAPVMLCQG